MSFWKNMPIEDRFYFESAELERKSLENRLQRTEEKLIKLETHLKTEGKSVDEIYRQAKYTDPEGHIAKLEARIKALETENEYLREANRALSAGQTPEEFLAEAAVPSKKIRNPGRPSLDISEKIEMRKRRKQGWTVREIADWYGKSVGSVQKAVASVEVDPEVVKKHREERNQALKNAKKKTHK